MADTREMSARDFDTMLREIAHDIPPSPLVQPENDLHPSPARLAFELKVLRHRVDNLERRLQHGNG